MGGDTGQLWLHQPKLWVRFPKALIFFRACLSFSLALSYWVAVWLFRTEH
jgi:hypothetical protein